MKRIVVKLIFERTCPATFKYYGTNNVEEMVKIEKEQMEDGEILWDMIENTEPKVEVTVEEEI